MTMATWPRQSPADVALRGACPRCGQGKLFRGLLTVTDRCAVCDLDLRAHDAGDGAAVGVVLVLGAIVVGMAFWVEFRFAPPLWLHALLWPVVTIPLAVVLMRPAKAALVALQFRHRASEMGL
jgi:uncharacterized protein (DUF983 family)